MREPPALATCSPARLFRVLSSRQPRWPLDFKPPGFESHKLEARGLSAHEADELLEAIEGDDRERGLLVLPAALVATALVEDGRRVFGSADEVADLPSSLVNPLAAAVQRALGVCSPLYGISEWAKWRPVLRRGAEKSSSVAGALGQADGPDRYFGVPLCDITDGQWMAYRVARELVESMRPKTPPPTTRRR